MKNRIVTFQQPALPLYRIPFFQEIAKRNSLDVTLYYGELPNINNCKPEKFRGELSALFSRRVAGFFIGWHQAQIKAVCGDANVVVLAWDVQYVSLYIAIAIAKIRKIPIILWGHGYSKREIGWRKKIRNMVGSSAAAIVVYSEYSLSLLEAEGWKKKNVFIAPNSLHQKGIESAIKQWDESKLERFQQQNGLENKKILIFIGRIYSDNRVDLLLDVLATLKKNGENVELLVIGRFDEDEENLKKRANDLHVENDVRWLGEIYKEDDIAPWMLSADVFCYPQNIGLSIMHAFGYSLPVVTSNNLRCHGPEIGAHKDQVNGFLYEHGCSKDMAEKVSWLVGDKALLNKMSLEAKKTVAEDYTIEKMVDGFVDAINYVKE